MTAAIVAVCAKCPVMAAAATELDLIPWLNKHNDSTGHHFWAISRITHTEEDTPK